MGNYNYIAEYRPSGQSTEDPSETEWVPDVFFELDRKGEYHRKYYFVLADSAEVQILPSCEKGLWGDLKKKLLLVQGNQPQSIGVRMLKGVWECEPALVVRKIRESSRTIKTLQDTVRRRNLLIKALRSEQNKR